MATIQGVYVALFGRPADPTGLAYFNGVTNNGADLSAIGDLASTAEYKERFKDQNNAQIVTAIYQSLFNRDPEAGGLNFFVNALNTGSLNINNIAIAILDGAQGSDKTIVDAKITAANNFTAAIDTPVEVANYSGTAAAQAGVNFLKPVVSTATIPDAAATDKAIADIGLDANKGNTLTPAIGADVVVGATAANATDKNDTINVATAVVDAVAVGKIDAGFGFDTVTLKTTGGVGAVGAAGATGAAGTSATIVATPEYTSVEKVVVTASGGAGGDGGPIALDVGGAGGSGNITLDVSKIVGLVELVNDSSTDGAAGAAGIVEAGGAGGTGNVQFDNVAFATKVTLKGAISGDTVVNYKDAAAGTADSATLSLDGATVTGSTTINAVETITIANTGTSSFALTADAAKTVNITGSGTFTSFTANAAAETISASGFSGAITTNLSGLNNVKSYVGGTGADKVTVDVSHANDTTVDAGAGSDTLILVAGADAATNKAITLTGGAGADIFEIGNGANVGNVHTVTTAADIVKSLVTISDFAKAEDAIKVNFAVAGESRDVLLGAELSQISAAADLKAALDIAATYTAVNSFSVFNFGSDAYIFNNVGGAGFGAGDTLVKITGISAADLVDSNFQLVA